MGPIARAILPAPFIHRLPVPGSGDGRSLKCVHKCSSPGERPGKKRKEPLEQLPTFLTSRTTSVRRWSEAGDRCPRSPEGFMVQRQNCSSPTGQIQEGFTEEVVSELQLQRWVCFSQ